MVFIVNSEIKKYEHLEINSNLKNNQNYIKNKKNKISTIIDDKSNNISILSTILCIIILMIWFILSPGILSLIIFNIFSTFLIYSLFNDKKIFLITYLLFIFYILINLSKIFNINIYILIINILLIHSLILIFIQYTIYYINNKYNLILKNPNYYPWCWYGKTNYLIIKK